MRDISPTDHRAPGDLVRTACQIVREMVHSGGDALIAESVLERFPELRDNDESAIEVIYTEFDARSCRQPLDRVTFLGRFPRYRERLERLFQIHDLMADDDQASQNQAPAASPIDVQHPSGADVNCDPRSQVDSPSDHYTILNEVGRGGMGIVYQARDNRLGRLVAIKTLRSFDGGKEAASRLVKEAAAAATLQHANVVQVFEVGESAVGPFCVMEWISGGSLEAVTKQRTLNAQEAALLLRKIALAVAYAHQHGIIHRDLKPGNILLTDEGEPKVADFGLAKFERTWTDSLTEAAGDQRTYSGAILGTPSYMAPEQAQGLPDQVGPSVDIYALGAILYEALTSRPPFLGSSTLETLNLVVAADTIPPSKLHPSLPRDLESICLKCLAKSPQQRYATAIDFAADLQRFLLGQPTLARPISRFARTIRWCRRYPTVASLLVALAVSLVLGFAGISWQWQNAARQASLAVRQQTEAEARRREAEEQRSVAVQQRARADQNLSAAQQVVERFAQIGAQYAQDHETEAVGRRLLEESLRYYLDILDLESDDDHVRFTTALAYHRAARIQNDLGRWDASTINSQKAMELLGELLKDAPTEVEYAFWLLECSFQHADGLRGQGRYDDARQAFANAVTLGETFVHRYPHELRLQSLLSITLINWRTLLDRDSDQAIAALRRAIELQESVVEATPNALWPLQDLAQGKDNLAAEAWRSGDLAEAERIYEEALAVRAKVSSLNPSDPAHQLYLVRNLTFLAQVNDRQRQFEKARQHHDEARRRLDQLDAEMQHAFRFRSERIKSDVAFAHHLIEAERYDEIGEHFQTALDRIVQMANDWPEGNRFPSAGVDLMQQVLDGLKSSGGSDAQTSCRRTASEQLPILYETCVFATPFVEMDRAELRQAIYLANRFKALAVRLQIPSLATKSMLRLARLQSLATIRQIPGQLQVGVESLMPSPNDTDR